MAPKVILVTGATGKQGGGVIDALLAQKDQQWELLAVTRTASSGSAQKLAAKSSSIKLVEGNLDDVPALFEAAKKVASGPIWGVYSVQVSQGKGVTHEGEIAQGKNLIDESIKEGVKHFVYSSVDRGGNEKSWDVETPIPHFQSKYHLERYLREQAGEKMGWTVLRPVAFMDVSLHCLYAVERKRSNVSIRTGSQASHLASSSLRSRTTWATSQTNGLLHQTLASSPRWHSPIHPSGTTRHKALQATARMSLI